MSTTSSLDWLAAALADVSPSADNTVAALAASACGGEAAVAERLAQAFGWTFVKADDLSGFTPAFDLLPLARSQQRQCLMLRAPDGLLHAALADPFDTDLLDLVATLTQGHVTYLLMASSELQGALAAREASVSAVDTLGLAEAGQAEAGELQAAAVLSLASASEPSSAAVRLVNSTLFDALRAGASDIHLESTTAGMAVRYRIDGVLAQAASVAGSRLSEQVISRLKVLASLDIAEQRVPQDGSFRVEAAGRVIDLRLSVMPSIQGEDAVIRILDKRNIVQEDGGLLTLAALGFEPQDLATLRALVEQPYGMLLVTGPTGSGKTTTLYAALSAINHGRDKIITIEDPVEYQLPGILQIPVNEKKGLNFARGLRSILRHDPDRIMVGEIRDRETAEIAVQSALTGHLVLSTVHANSVYDVFSRFAHMGVDPYGFVSALNGVWAQRLVRLVCPQCVRMALPQASLLARLQREDDAVAGRPFPEAVGCPSCRGSGYKGRHAIAEILQLDDALRDMVIERRPPRQLKLAARERGTRSLRAAALALAQSGRTTLDEVLRVTLHD